MSQTTIDQNEIARFDKLANEWWDTKGQYKLLHQMNPIRIKYIKEVADNHSVALNKATLLDVGCGGGLVSVPFARMGANVTAIDASSENIKIAQHYAKTQNLKINYKNISAESLAQEKGKFDVILALEIIEHVANVDLFIKSLAKMLKPNGLIFISTINRTLKSHIAAKFMAEYVLGIVPIGTHEFKKFIKPEELGHCLNEQGLKLQNVTGMTLNPFTSNWSINKHDTDINYISYAKFHS